MGSPKHTRFLTTEFSFTNIPSIQLRNIALFLLYSYVGKYAWLPLFPNADMQLWQPKLNLNTLITIYVKKTIRFNNGKL